MTDRLSRCVKRFQRIVLALLLWHPVSAQDHAHNVRFYGLDEGLPHREVRDIVQGPRGFIWLATPIGLARFDGYTFKVLGRAQGLFANDPIDIENGPGGEIWVRYGSSLPASPSLAIDILDPATLKVQRFQDRFGTAVPCGPEDIVGMSADSAGSLVLTTSNGDAIVFFGGTRFERIAPSVKGAWAWRSTAMGLVTVGSTTSRDVLPTYVHHMDRRGHTLLHVDMPAITAALPGNAPERYGCYFIGGRAGEQHEYWLAPDGNWRDNGVYSHLSRPYNVLREPLADGVMLVDTALRRMAPGEASMTAPVLADLVSEYPALASGLWCVTRGREGYTWLGTNFGLYRIEVKPSAFRRMLHTEHPPKGFGKSIRGMAARAGLLHVNTELGGAYTLDAKSGAVLYVDPSGLRYPLLLDDQDRLWGWVSQTIDRSHGMDREVERRYTHTELRNYVWSLFLGKDGRMLVGSERGLFVLDTASGECHAFGKNGPLIGLADSRVECILADRAGTMLACTTNGLYELDGETVRAHWTMGDSAHPLPADHILHAYADATGGLWLGTLGGGLVRLDRTTRRSISYTTAEGLPSNTVYAVYADADGLLWLPTDNGIARFDPATGKSTGYTVKDGIALNEFNRLAHTQGEDGTLYFGGLNGITAFHPKDFRDRIMATTAPLVITGLQQFDAATDSVLDRTAEVVTTNSITMQPGDRFFQLDMALLSFTGSSAIRYAWRIDGLDEEWIEQQEPTLRITRLPYGEHVLRIRAHDGSGVWGAQELAITVHSMKPGYLRWWAIALMVLSVTGIVWLVLRYRIAQERKLFAVRDRIAADLHDELGSTLSSIALYSATARHRAGPSEMPLLDRITEDTSSALESMNDIIWNMSARFVGMVPLIDRMRAFAVRVSEEADVSLIFTVGEGVEKFPLAMEPRRNLYLLFKDAVQNVVKHAACTTLTIDVRIAGGYLELHVEDDGRGFVPPADITASALGGNGLRNMHKRATALHGDLQVRSNPSKGTIISLAIPG